ncbi:MAG: RNA polymerase sigma factor [Planctomycetes bacterium]|nr:RNA polymerase sigma factor [Planctomycetota bacterium]
MSDQDLAALQRFLQGDSDAFDAIIERHYRNLRHYIFAMVGSEHDAEDLVHDVFIKVMRKADTFEPKFKVSTWLYRVARNTVLDFLKYEGRRKHQSLDAPIGPLSQGEAGNVFADLVPSSALESFELASKKELITLITRYIGELTDQRREALTLHYFQGLRYSEISDIVGVPEGTLKFRVFEAVREIKGKLLKACGMEAG